MLAELPRFANTVEHPLEHGGNIVRDQPAANHLSKRGSTPRFGWKLEKVANDQDGQRVGQELALKKQQTDVTA